MQTRRQWRTALVLSAAALGVNFESGRAVAAFYAQMGKVSWLGAMVSAGIFGCFMALLTALARRCGARSMLSLLRRASLGGFYWMAAVLYLFIVAGGMSMALISAGRVGALVLPIRHAFMYGAALCLLISLAIALWGSKAMGALGAMFCSCTVGYLLALMFFAVTPDDTVLVWRLDLRLENNIAAALLFALLHGSTMVCISAGAAVRLANARTHPRAVGAYSFLACFILLALGNAVLRLRANELLVLKLPFVALASGWGTVGFYLSSAMLFFAAVSSASSLLFAVIPKHKCPNLIEK